MGRVLDRASTGLFIDFDGTISAKRPPLSVEPDTAHPGVEQSLNLLAQRHMVVLLSARAAASFRDLLPDAIGLWCVGNMGAEVLRPGDSIPVVHPGMERWKTKLADIEREIAEGIGSDVRFENHGWVLEIRTPPDRRGETQAWVRAMIDRTAPEFSLLVTRSLGLQLLSPGIDKGQALTRFASDHALSGVVMAGDNSSDWPAFHAVQRLRAEGLSGMNLLVTNGHPMPDEIRTAIDACFVDASDLALFLEAAA